MQLVNTLTCLEKEACGSSTNMAFLSKIVDGHNDDICALLHVYYICKHIQSICLSNLYILSWYALNLNQFGFGVPEEEIC